MTRLAAKVCPLRERPIRWSETTETILHVDDFLPDVNVDFKNPREYTVLFYPPIYEFRKVISQRNPVHYMWLDFADCLLVARVEKQISKQLSSCFVIGSTVSR